jgi:hypothetical protein
LQRHRKIPATFGIFRRKSAAEENRHDRRIARLGIDSTRRGSSFDDSCIIR